MAADLFQRSQGCSDKSICTCADIKGSLEWAELSSILGKEESILEYEALKLISEKEGLKRRWD